MEDLLTNPQIKHAPFSDGLKVGTLGGWSHLKRHDGGTEGDTGDDPEGEKPGGDNMPEGQGGTRQGDKS